MNKGMIRAISAMAFFLLAVNAAPAADIWKIVDKDGNVVYTDQAPKDGSAPMDLPELSIIETNFQVNKTPAEGSKNVAGEGAKPLTSRELRKRYRDFRMIQPLQEETFWGTASTVVVAWASNTAIAPDLSVRLFVDGKAQDAPAIGSVSLTLDRGEHKVFAELRDARKRSIVKTKSVTFYIKQNSVKFNRQRPTPSGGSG